MDITVPAIRANYLTLSVDITQDQYLTSVVFCRSNGTFIVDQLGESGSESESQIGPYHARSNHRQYELREIIEDNAQTSFSFSL